MDKIKTEECQGQVYEIGQNYLFNDGGDYWHCLRLKRIVKGYPTRFETWVTPNKFTVFNFIKELPDFERRGTITPAPIKLDHGKAYTFDYRANRDSSIGVYSESENTFITVGNDYFVFDCTNIRLMTVESK